MIMMCDICFEDICVYIKFNCQHYVCISCFDKLRVDHPMKCPFCRQRVLITTYDTSIIKNLLLNYNSTDIKILERMFKYLKDVKFENNICDSEVYEKISTNPYPSHLMKILTILQNVPGSRIPLRLSYFNSDLNVRFVKYNPRTYNSFRCLQNYSKFEHKFGLKYATDKCSDIKKELNISIFGLDSLRTIIELEDSSRMDLLHYYLLYHNNVIKFAYWPNKKTLTIIIKSIINLEYCLKNNIKNIDDNYYKLEYNKNDIKNMKYTLISNNHTNLIERYSGDIIHIHQLIAKYKNIDINYLMHSIARNKSIVRLLLNYILLNYDIYYIKHNSGGLTYEIQ